MVQMDPVLTLDQRASRCRSCSSPGFNMRKKLFPIAWMMMARTADIATIVEENVTGTRVVKSFAAEKSQLSLFDRAARRLRWASIQQVNNQARYGPLMQSIPQLSLVIILLVGGYQVIHGHMSLGTFIVFNTYVVMLQVPFVMIGMIMMMAQRAAASAARVLEVLDTEPDMVDAPDAVDLVECDGDVEFRDVDFEYLDGIPVLAPLLAAPAPRRDGRARRAHRLREVHGVAPDPALLRRHRRVAAHRRPRRARPHDREPPLAHRHGHRRAVPVLRVDPREHRLRSARRVVRRRRSRGDGGRRPRLHPRARPTATTP